MEIWLPIILFLITLAIIILLRIDDRRDMRLNRVKEINEQFRSSVAKANASVKENSQQASNEINAQVVSVNELIHSIDGKLSDLEGRSDDLTKLQAVMNNYRSVLGELAQTTSQAETRIKEIAAQTQQLLEFQKTLDAFQSGVETIKSDVATMEETAVSTIKSTEAESQQKLETISNDINTTLTEASGKLTAYTTSLRQAEEESLEKVKNNEAESQKKLDGYASLVDTKVAQADEKLELSLETLRKAEADASAAVAKQSAYLEELGKQAAQSVEASRGQFNQLQVDAQAQANKDLAAFTVACSEKLELVFKQTIEQIDASFLTMVRTSQVFINELDSHLASTREVTAALDAQSSASLSDLIKKLQDHNDQLSASLTMNASQENRKKQMEESIAAMKQEADGLHDELMQLKEQKAAILQTMDERAESISAQEAIPTTPIARIVPEEDIVAPESTEEPEQEEPEDQEPEEQEQDEEDDLDAPVSDDDIDEEATAVVEGSHEPDIDPNEPLPIPEPEQAFVQEDKPYEPEEMPELSDLVEEDENDDEHKKAKEKGRVNFVPIGQEEDIDLSDDKD